MPFTSPVPGVSLLIQNPVDDIFGSWKREAGTT